jgi:IS5 family transposase
MINGFFDIEYRLEQLSKCGDPLVKLKEIVPWASFRNELSKVHDKERKSTAGRKPYDTVLMFKILILQSLYNLSDEAMEYQVRDRLSFMRFLNLAIEDSVPDARTIWLFREQLKELKLVKKLFADFDRYLAESGFEAKKGQIIDASIVAAPKQRNNRDENGQIKDGEIPKDWSQKKRSHKDTDANWVQKNGKNYFGYKNHVEVDVKHKFIRRYKVTPSSVHDSNVFEEILDKNNTSKDVFADSAYRSKESLKELETLGFREHLQRKGCKNKKLSNWEMQGNLTRSKIRSRIEHVFGVQAQRAKTLIIRTIGIIRADIKIGLRNLAYNMQRYSILAV